MRNIEKQLQQVWQIKSITNIDGTEKETKRHLYDLWTSQNYYIYGLFCKYYLEYGSRYTLNWEAIITNEEMIAVADGHTSLVDEIQEKDNSLIVRTTKSIYTFVKSNKSIDEIINRAKFIN